MHPVRILLVTHYFSTHRGGVEQVAAQLAKRLLASGGFEVEWMATACDEPPVMPAGVTLRPAKGWNALEQFGFPWPLWSWHSLCELRNGVKQVDVLHLHDYIYCGNIAAFFLARRYGKPVVITQHIGDATYRNPLVAAGLKLLNRTLGRFMLARAQQVVFISHEVRRQFTAYTRFAAEPALWPNGVDSTIFYPVQQAARQELRSRLGAQQGRPVILFVGRFVGMKGLGLLRQLAASVPEVDWWFAGWGSGQNALHPASWGLPNVQVFVDRSGEALADCYRAADLLVLPSYSEGFPLVVQEAMACGTPALVSEEAAEGAPDARKQLFICALEPSASACDRWQAAVHAALASAQQQPRQDALASYARGTWAWDECVAHYAALFRKL